MENKAGQDRRVKKVTEADKIARFYGFQPIVPPAVSKQDYEYVKEFDQSLFPSEKAALLRVYFEDKMMVQSQPAMLYCERPFKAPSNIAIRKNPHRLEGCLVSVGSSKSVCECLSIQAAIAILGDMGYRNLEVEVNSVGDKESSSEFQRKLTFFIRKNINSFPADLRQALKKDIYSIRRQVKDDWQCCQEECPKTIDFLSEQSRLHFKEVLEFLEIMEIPYKINHHLIGDPEIGSETVFSIKDDEEELASGFRFNRLAKRIGCKKDLPATLLNLFPKIKKVLKKVKVREVKPRFYLVQFGPEAKLKSFLVLEELFKAGAPVIHSIAKDKLGGQINVAETSEASYILLMGQKEALENSVIIRNSSTRAQEVVSICDLASKAKELI